MLGKTGRPQATLNRKCSNRYAACLSDLGRDVPKGASLGISVREVTCPSSSVHRNATQNGDKTRTHTRKNASAVDKTCNQWSARDPGRSGASVPKFSVSKS